MTIKLFKLDKTLRHFLAAFILLLSFAVSTGLGFIYHTTAYEKEGVVERYRGSDVSAEFEIPDQFPKSMFEMLLNTHNHLFGFAFIFLAIGTIFYFNSIVTNSWKYFLMVEPFVSVLFTFTGLWLIRFVETSFIYVVFLSAVLTYVSFYLMAFISFYELLFKAGKQAIE